MLFECLLFTFDVSCGCGNVYWMKVFVILSRRAFRFWLGPIFSTNLHRSEPTHNVNGTRIDDDCVMLLNGKAFQTEANRCNYVFLKDRYSLRCASEFSNLESDSVSTVEKADGWRGFRFRETAQIPNHRIHRQRIYRNIVIFARSISQFAPIRFWW